MNDFILVNYIIPILFGVLLIISKGIFTYTISIITMIIYEILIYIISYQCALMENSSIVSLLMMYIPGAVITFVYIIITLIQIIRWVIKNTNSKDT